jgi:hypothetical protein
MSIEVSLKNRLQKPFGDVQHCGLLASCSGVLLEKPASELFKKFVRLKMQVFSGKQSYII